ncbi:MAG: lamin tail domain-containing protein [Dehalococcoidia bacterium]|nr:lamin tail domain-containing protein [Dehalococcoidia bacterium]
MKNKAIRYLISFTVLLFLTLSLVVACAQPNPSPPPALPKNPPAQPPTASENQPPEEQPPVNESKDEEERYTTGTFSGEGNDTIPSFHIYGTEWRITWTIDAADPETAIFKLVIYQKDAPYVIWQTVSNSGDSGGDATYVLFSGDKRDFFIKVTAQNLRQWSIIVEDNATAATSYPVRITYIHYKGTVYPPVPEVGLCYERVEPDEYVVIKNLSECYVDVSGWVLKNVNKIYPLFTFPSAMLLPPGAVIRVYTDEVHPETGGFCFYWGPGDIWSNDKPDIAVLYDAQGNEVSRKSYTLPMKINEASN